MLQNKKHILITAVGIVIVFVAIIAGAIYFVPGGEEATQQQTTQRVQHPSDESIQTRVVSSLRVRKDIKNFAQDVDVILIGTVKSISSPYQTGNTIYSDIIIQVDRYLKNPQPNNELTIKREGGQFGNLKVIAEDQPQFVVDEQVLLFLGTTSAKDFVVYAGDYGKFTIDNNIAIGSENERSSLVNLIGQIKANIK